MLQTIDITLGYKDGKPLATGVNLLAKGGELVALVGRNGSGKSTLLRSLAGLVHPRAGEVRVEGVDIFELSSIERARKVAFVSTEVVRIAHLRVCEVVAMGRAPYTGWSGSLSEQDKVVVDSSLERVGMSHFADVSLARLSDGERQRIMVARALAQDTPIVILDEPTAFLDLPNRYSTTRLLQELAHNMGKSIIFSTHELSLACELADQLWVLSGGTITSGSPSSLEGSTPLLEVMGCATRD